ncbi:AMP-binding protein [Coralloluteibacterium stylophorae]|uniref:AMP-binding protein n=1 Tax=Coralloluteibacterium stylophorae TaxID=1776034 RepID=A0A8J7VVH4_9GAMM|nr:AMP-binding protein [Coralloluteibacterium stylophorae]MBS7458760.1 AMP-binding protein [Coralloluteibacterium stylophorae]
MSAVVNAETGVVERLPLLWGTTDRVFAFDAGRRVSAGEFLARVRAVAATLPEAGHVLNLCEERYAFLVGLCAALLRGQVSLLPSSRAPEVVADLLAQYGDAYCLGDACTRAPPPGTRLLRVDLAQPCAEVPETAIPELPADRVVLIGFTSGSTGQPKAHAKTWGALRRSDRGNAALLAAHLPTGALAEIVATVPSQHMYGIETSVLLPLLGPFAIHTGRPFFPADVAAALEHCRGPRVLVSTPVHLRNLLAGGVPLRGLQAVVSATAPLSRELAAAVEAAWGAPVLEVFGSTETCVFAHRRTAVEADWTLRAGVDLHPQPDGSVVDAPWLAAPTALQDIVELLPDRRFRLHGRSADLLEIAGKRASLGELTRRLLAIPGVVDGIVFQREHCDVRGVRPIVALAVAPGLAPAQILERLRQVVDPVFLPRPLRCVDALPRNETGKLPRAALAAALERAAD